MHVNYTRVLSCVQVSVHVVYHMATKFIISSLWIVVKKPSYGWYIAFVRLHTAGASYVTSGAIAALYDQSGLRASIEVPTTGYPSDWTYWRTFEVNPHADKYRVVNSVFQTTPSNGDPG